MKIFISPILLAVLCMSCNSAVKKKEKEAYSKQPDTIVQTAIGSLQLPPPYETSSAVLRSSMKKWPANQTPIAPSGFTVTRFASDLENPRNTYVAPNNDIFVAESNTSGSANRITVFRDSNRDGKYETRSIFLENLNLPYGMLVLNNYFYVANTDGLYRYPYKNELVLKAAGEKILDLPAGGYNNHWTRNLLATADGSKIYISVGSGSNVGENGLDEEKRRANILVINPDGTNEKIYAYGLRNPVGMDWNPANGELWTAVNERDGLGDDLVPDYVTSVKPGAFYGWPYSYYGEIQDPRMKDKGEAPAKATMPDVPVGSHTASLGLTFYTGNSFPEKYKNGAFVGQHGSWNRSKISGYKVLFVPFENGKPATPVDFLTGFVANADNAKVYGRPVDVTVAPDGSLLVNDDSGNIIWQISPK